jgi:hypothetical protein
MKNLRAFDITSGPFIITVAGLIIIGLAGFGIGQHGLGYRGIIAGLLALAGLVLVIAGERGLTTGILLWVWMFVIGFRTIHITSAFPLHPLEIFISALLLLILLKVSVMERRRVVWPIPGLLWVFSIFWIWGWLRGVLDGRHWDVMLSEALNFVMFFPVFMVTGHILENRANWRSLVGAFVSVGTAIALLGLVEYLFPGVRNLFPGYVAADTTYIAQGGFVRASYVFWGNPVATFICAFALPLLIPMWEWWPQLMARGLLIGSAVILVAGIYIGGFRSLWLLLGVALIVLLYISRGLWGALAASFSLGVLYVVLPETGQSRLLLAVSALRGDFQDSSSFDRWQRVVGAAQSILSHPEGQGWSAAGWVHNDFLQVAVNLGLIAGVIFLLWYLRTLIGLWRQWRRQPADSLTLALFTSFFILGGLFLSQPMIVLPQLALPAWLVWALAEIHLRQSGPLAAGAVPVADK